MKDIKAPKLKPLVVNDPNDASLKWTGEKVMGDEIQPKKRQRASKGATGRKRQKSFTIKHESTLRQLSETIGISEAAVVNLGIHKLVKEYL